jgi:hypothetical protein
MQPPLLGSSTAAAIFSETYLFQSPPEQEEPIIVSPHAYGRRSRHAQRKAAAGEESKMTSTFLHEDNKVPPDEAVERDAPHCKTCGQQMWAVRVETVLSDDGTLSKRDYECGRCGAKQTVRTSSKTIAPSSLATGI